MADIKNKYGTNTAIPCTLASLANTSSRCSLVVDNTANLYLDALLTLTLVTGTGSSATGYVSVYLYGSADNVKYTENATGTDTGITVPANSNLIPLKYIPTPTASATYNIGPMSVAQAFGGTMPAYWGIVIQNNTGAALGATDGGSGHTKTFIGVLNQVG